MSHTKKFDEEMIREAIETVRAACSQGDDALLQAIMNASSGSLIRAVQSIRFQKHLPLEDFRKSVTDFFGEGVTFKVPGNLDSGVVYFATVLLPTFSEDDDEEYPAVHITYPFHRKRYEISTEFGNGSGETIEAAYNNAVENWNVRIASERRKMDRLEALVTKIGESK